MKIKKKIQINFIVIIILIGIFIYYAWLTQSKIHSIFEKNHYLEKIEIEITKYSLHLHEYLLRFEQRPLIQLKEHKKNIDEILYKETKEKKFLYHLEYFNILYSNIKLIQIDFEQLVDLIKSNPDNKESEKFKRLISQILIKTYIVIDATDEVALKNHNKLNSAVIDQNLFFIIISLCIFILFLTHTLWLYNSVINPLIIMSEKVTAINDENLVFDDEIKSDDELGNLSSSIADMVKRVDTTLEERQFLIKEMNHRVKNNLTILHSLVYLQLDKTDDHHSKSILNDFANRILLLKIIHEKLYKSDSFKYINIRDYLESLTEKIYQSFEYINKKITYDLEISDSMLHIKYIIPCGLIVNELMTNAIKYAFPDRNEGNILISFKEKENMNYQLLVKDSGIGLPKELENEKSFGIGLEVVDSLVIQIKGEIEYRNNNGAEITITFQGKVD